MTFIQRDPRELPRAGEWLTAAEAARTRGVTRQYVVRAIKSGELRGLQWGRCYVLHAADVAAWEPKRRGRPRKIG